MKVNIFAPKYLLLFLMPLWIDAQSQNVYYHQGKETESEMLIEQWNVPLSSIRESSSYVQETTDSMSRVTQLVFYYAGEQKRRLIDNPEIIDFCYPDEWTIVVNEHYYDNASLEDAMQDYCTEVTTTIFLDQNNAIDSMISEARFVKNLVGKYLDSIDKYQEPGFAGYLLYILINELHQEDKIIDSLQRFSLTDVWRKGDSEDASVPYYVYSYYKCGEKKIK